jgi:predicted nicotinamide N-methyase
VKQNPTAVQGSNIKVGCCAWDGAYILSAYLQSLPEGSFKGLRVVELGAGVGMVGLVLAKLGANVVVTDKPSMLVLPRLNAAKNKLAQETPEYMRDSQSGTISVIGLDWEAEDAAKVTASLAETPVGLVVATDCVYPDPNGTGRAPSSELFMKACQQICHQGTKVLITFENRSPVLKGELLSAAARHFTQIIEVPRADWPTPFQVGHIEMYELKL